MLYFDYALNRLSTLLRNKPRLKENVLWPLSLKCNARLPHRPPNVNLTPENFLLRLLIPASYHTDCEIVLTNVALSMSMVAKNLSLTWGTL